MVDVNRQLQSKISIEAFNMENIFTTSKPILVFAKFLGLFPMTFIGPDRKGVFKVMWHDVLSSCISIGSLLCLVGANISLGIFFTGDSNILAVAWFIMKNFDISTYACLFCYQVYKRKNILKFLNMIFSFDEDVSVNIYHKFSAKLQFIL